MFKGLSTGLDAPGRRIFSSRQPSEAYWGRKGCQCSIRDWYAFSSIIAPSVTVFVNPLRKYGWWGYSVLNCSIQPDVGHVKLCVIFENYLLTSRSPARRMTSGPTFGSCISKAHQQGNWKDFGQIIHLSHRKGLPSILEISISSIPSINA